VVEQAACLSSPTFAAAANAVADWHKAVMRSGKARAMTFAPFAKDLIARGVTRPIRGSPVHGRQTTADCLSAIAHTYPELFTRHDCAVPLLRHDALRSSRRREAGILDMASVKAEDWLSCGKFNAYHTGEPARHYPPIR